MAMKIGVTKKGEGKTGYKWKKGTFVARLVRVYELGLQPQTDWKTQKPKPAQYEIMFTFEFPTCRFEIEMDGEKKELQAWLSKTLTQSFSEKANLPKYVEAMDPEGTCSDLQELLGRAIMVTIGFTKNDKPKIVAVSGVPEGMSVGELTNDTGWFDMDSPNMELYANLPDFVKEKLSEAKNLDKTAFGAALADMSAAVPAGVDVDEDADDELNDEVPF